MSLVEAEEISVDADGVVLSKTVDLHIKRRRQNKTEDFTRKWLESTLALPAVRLKTPE